MNHAAYLPDERDDAPADLIAERVAHNAYRRALAAHPHHRDPNHPELPEAENDVAGAGQDEVQMLRGALDHIAKTADRSSTSTRRLRWIADRARCALEGRTYRREEHDLPKFNQSSVERRVRRYQAESDALAKALQVLILQCAKRDPKTLDLLPADQQPVAVRESMALVGGCA